MHNHLAKESKNLENEHYLNINVYSLFLHYQAIHLNLLDILISNLTRKFKILLKILHSFIH